MPGATPEESESGDPSLGLAGLLFAQRTLTNVLESVVDIAADVVEGAEGVSLTLPARQHGFRAAIASSARLRELDDAQYRSGRGPCVEAFTTGAEVDAVLPSDRWPEFSTEAAAIGIWRVWSAPLRTRGETRGALNLFWGDGAGAHRFSAASARILAAQAAAVVANAHEFAEVTFDNMQLRQALETRTVIGQAQGVLMARQRLDAASAFDVLRRASQRENRKLHDIAADIVASALTGQMGT